MTEFDSFSTQLLEESKALLEKAKSAEPFTQSAYLHAGLLLTMSALEACLNSMAEELLIEPYGDSYTVYERALLLEKEVVLIDTLQYLPMLLGILLALTQFVPEMSQTRLKLTLHLPFPERRMILLMEGIGAGALTLLLLLQGAILWGYLATVLPPELTARILLTSLPWALAGLTLYLLTAWICLEPTWRRRIVNILIAAAIGRLFFLSDLPEAYNGMIPCQVYMYFPPRPQHARRSCARRDRHNCLIPRPLPFGIRWKCPYASH